MRSIHKMGMVLLVCCMAGSAFAAADLEVRVSGGDYQVNPGGEFTVEVLSSTIGSMPVGYRFQSFCVERNENLSLGGTYYAVVNTDAVLGGQGGPSDRLEPGTAWLYNQFLAESLAGYEYANTAGHRDSAAALQNAIWSLEGEANDGSGASFFTAANDSGWTDIGPVRVLNLYRDANLTQRAQDVLAQPVPAPGGILLVALGSACAGVVRRRRLLK